MHKIEKLNLLSFKNAKYKNVFKVFANHDSKLKKKENYDQNNENPKMLNHGRKVHILKPLKTQNFRPKIIFMKALNKKEFLFFPKKKTLVKIKKKRIS